MMVDSGLKSSMDAHVHVHSSILTHVQTVHLFPWKEGPGIAIVACILIKLKSANQSAPLLVIMWSLLHHSSSCESGMSIMIISNKLMFGTHIINMVSVKSLIYSL